MLELVPDSSGRIDWARIEALQLVGAMRGCPQDPRYHAEGDVWTHTRMVVQALITSSQWRTGELARPESVFLACLLHDVGKPECTRVEEDGSISSRGHSGLGETICRRSLWKAGVPFELREQVCMLVRFHQLPFNILRSRDVERDILRAGLLCRLDDLCAVATFDNRGRQSDSQAETAAAIELFRDMTRDEYGCYDCPPRFASDHSRFMYFHGNYHRSAIVHDECRFEVIMLSGFPGAGKDTWIRRHRPDWPVISLDEIRRRMGVKPSGSQMAVAHAAKDDSRVLMRQGQSFVFNATNLSKRRRTEWIGHFRQYGARIHIVYIEPPRDRLLAQNADRSLAVPQEVIEHLARDWQVPTLEECHTLAFETTAQGER